MPDVPLTLTLYYDQRDVTRWVTDLALRQAPRVYYRQLDVTFGGWFPPDLTLRWDLYGSHDPTNPRAELLLRGGIIPPDQPGRVDVATRKVIPCAVTIVDWAWLAQRRTPRTTLVLAATRAAAEKAVRSSEFAPALAPDARGILQPVRISPPLGGWSWIRAATMHQAVTALGLLAGFRVSLRLPDYDLAPMVLDPQRTLWEDIADLVSPLAPDIFFRRDVNELLVTDRLAEFVGVGRTINLGARAISGLSIYPAAVKHVKRLLVATPETP